MHSCLRLRKVAQRQHFNHTAYSIFYVIWFKAAYLLTYVQYMNFIIWLHRNIKLNVILFFLLCCFIELCTYFQCFFSEWLPAILCLMKNWWVTLNFYQNASNIPKNLILPQPIVRLIDENSIKINCDWINIKWVHFKY